MFLLHCIILCFCINVKGTTEIFQVIHCTTDNLPFPFMQEPTEKPLKVSRASIGCHASCASGDFVLIIHDHGFEPCLPHKRRTTLMSVSHSLPFKRHYFPASHTPAFMVFDTTSNESQGCGRLGMRLVSPPFFPPPPPPPPPTSCPI